MARLARRRRTLLLKKGEYKEVPELEKAMGMLEKDKFDKMITFLESPVGQKVRTNNHVERTNRKLRFDEKVRYKFRTQRSLERFVRLRLARLTDADQSRPPKPANAQANRKKSPPLASIPGRR